MTGRDWNSDWTSRVGRPAQRGMQTFEELVGVIVPLLFLLLLRLRFVSFILIWGLPKNGEK